MKSDEELKAFESGEKTASDILTRWAPRPGRSLAVGSGGGAEKKKATAPRKPGPLEVLKENGPTAPPNEPCSFLTRPVNGTLRPVEPAWQGQPLYMQHIAFTSERPEVVENFYTALLSMDRAMEIGPGMAYFGTWDEENHRIVVATATPGRKTKVIFVSCFQSFLAFDGTG